MTDFAIIRKMLDLLDGSTSFDSGTPLGYDGTATISTPNQFATKAYIDGIAIAGSPDATTSTKGIGRVSVAPASAATPIFVGDNDNRVPTINTSTITAGMVEALAGTSGTPSTSNKYVTNDDTATAATADKVARRLAGGNVTVITETAGNNTTNAASTAFVTAAVVAGASGYDSLTITRDSATASGTQVINHNLGKTPKGIKFSAIAPVNMGTTSNKYCSGSYD